MRIENFGWRLKEERERLGFSQAKFGEACGVGRTAQFNYERGEREPDSSYLTMAEGIGVDVGYVLSGKRQAERDRDRLEADLEEFGKAFAAVLGIADSDILKAREVVSAGMEEHNEVLERSGRAYYGKWKTAYEAEFLKAAGPLVDNSPKLRAVARTEFDLPLLVGVIERVESSLPEGLVLPAIKKARLIAMLYRSFETSGKVDPAMIDEAVKLATT